MNAGKKGKIAIKKGDDYKNVALKFANVYKL